MILVGVIDSGRRAAPGTPTIGTATDVGTARAFNNGAAIVTFTQGSGVTPTSYTVKAYNSAGVYQNISATGASSPITVTGLLSNTNYKFTVFATAGTNSSAESAFSNEPLITTVPQAPTIGTATAGNALATVEFTGNATGGKTVSTYTATSSPSSITGSSATTPITVSGLSNGTPYTFTVTATNANGTSIASAASNSVTPSPPPQYVVTSTSLTPFVNGYPWTNGTGFGSRYANPSTLPAAAALTVAQANGNTVAFGEFNSPRVDVYAWSASGFGAKFANPASIPTARATDVRFTSNGNALAASIATTATLVAWPWSGGFGTQYAAPAYVPSGNQGNGITFNPANNVILNTNNDSTQYVSAWNWNPGFGTKFANPSTATGSGPRKPRFNPAGTVVTWTNSANATLNTYLWSGGFSTRYAQPASPPSFGGEDCAWNGNSIVAYSTDNLAQPLAVYNFSGGYGTRFTNPILPSNSGGSSVAFTSDSNTILVGVKNGANTNVTLHAYVWSNSTGYGTKYANPAGYSTAQNLITYGIVGF